MKFFKPDIEKMRVRFDGGGLIKALSHKDPKIRKNAAWALGTMNCRSDRIMEALISVLRDPEADVRCYAAEALGSVSGDEPHDIEPLIMCLHDSDYNVRAAAAYSLRKYREESRVVESLITVLRSDANPGVRANAAYTLGKSGDTRAIEPLMAALPHEDADVRYYAAEALGEVGDQRALEKLEQMAREDRGETYLAHQHVADAAQTAAKKIRYRISPPTIGSKPIINTNAPIGYNEPSKSRDNVHQKTCRLCAGTGRLICQVCRGGGKCADCGGAGVIASKREKSKPFACLPCSGSGRCQVCRGQGGGICPRCNGTGDWE
jgi:hypothetical protein